MGGLIPRSFAFFLPLLGVLAAGPLRAEPPPPGPLQLQLLLAVAPDADSMRGLLRFYERDGAGKPWRAEGEGVPILYGKHGLAWGRGLHTPQPGLQKKEGDGRTPMGRFAIGTIVGDAPALPSGAKWTDYVHKTERVAWIDDPAIPEQYNHLYALKDGEAPPPWFERERMRLNDPAHEWEVLIEHNYPDAVPGAGSAIFFHVRRAEDRPSAGCTVMAREDLERLVTWLDPEKHPQLVQLTEADYRRLWKDWDLPQPSPSP